MPAIQTSLARAVPCSVGSGVPALRMPGAGRGVFAAHGEAEVVLLAEFFELVQTVHNEEHRGPIRQGGLASHAGLHFGGQIVHHYVDFLAARHGDLMRQAGNDAIQEIRIKGCMIGIDLTADGAPLVKACMERGLLINCTHQTVLRLLPAMNLSDAELNEGCAILEEALVQTRL